MLHPSRAGPHSPSPIGPVWTCSVVDPEPLGSGTRIFPLATSHELSVVPEHWTIFTTWPVRNPLQETATSCPSTRPVVGTIVALRSVGEDGSSDQGPAVSPGLLPDGQDRGEVIAGMSRLQ